LRFAAPAGGIDPSSLIK